MIPVAVTEYWDSQFDAGTTLFDGASFRLTVNDALPLEHCVMVLEVGALTRAVITPDVADALAGVSSREEFGSRLDEADIRLHGVDRLYYVTSPVPVSDPAVRRLAPDDAELFARFEAATSDQDRDNASVALDDWAVFGAFVGDELVSVASAYPWRTSPLADMGVLTVESARGAGHGRRVIHALSAFALDEGFQPQYRSQPENHASIALARGAGLEFFGNWNIVTPD